MPVPIIIPVVVPVTMLPPSNNVSVPVLPKDAFTVPLDAPVPPVPSRMLSLPSSAPAVFVAIAPENAAYSK